MLPRSYPIREGGAIADAVKRLLAAARRRRLALGAECDPAEASRRESASVAVALVAATAIEAAEGVRR